MLNILSQVKFELIFVYNMIIWKIGLQGLRPQGFWEEELGWAGPNLELKDKNVQIVFIFSSFIIFFKL